MSESQQITAALKAVQAFTKHPLNIRQVMILMELADRGDNIISVRELAEALEVSKPAITRGLDTLSVEGLVVRRHNPGDRRMVDVRLTTAGQRAVAAAREHYRSAS